MDSLMDFYFSCEARAMHIRDSSQRSIVVDRWTTNSSDTLSQIISYLRSVRGFNTSDQLAEFFADQTADAYADIFDHQVALLGDIPARYKDASGQIREDACLRDNCLDEFIAYSQFLEEELSFCANALK